MTHLKIQLLANFRLSLDGRPYAKVNTRRLQTLLAYLLLQRKAPQPRRNVAFLFWPDSTEKQALSNLRTLYARLRRKLASPDLFLQGDRQTIQWLPDAPFTLDVAEFEATLSNATTATDWKSAVDLYRGPLLPGWYEEWLEPERKRLHQLFLQAGKTLLQLLEDQHSYGEGIQIAQKLLRHDPLDESIYRRLMCLQALQGAKADALRTYHTCASLLGKELGVPPDKPTRALYEQLLHAGSDLAPAPILDQETAVAPLIGREDELSALKRTCETTRRGSTRLVLISGEPGIGKSRLAGELLQWAQRKGIDTAATRSYEAEGELAYAPVLTWLRTPALEMGWKQLDDVILRELSRLLPELLVERLDLPAPTPMSESWHRQRLFEALAQAIFAVGRPLVLHIDDLQWCDQATLEWLHFLLRFRPRAPLLIVGTYRPGEISSEHPLAALQFALHPSRQLTVLELERLQERETSLLATHLTGQLLDPGAAGRLYQETEGNPLFVIEMMRSQMQEKGDLPPTIQAMIRARIARLTPEARGVMTQAAVIGRAFDYDLLAQSCGMSEDVLVNRLDELWRKGLIREHGGAEYDFSHDKFREVAYADLSQARRRLLHRRTAQALEALHASHLEAYSGQIAAHYEQADLPRKAIPHYQRAAQEARRLYANEESIRYIRRTLELLPSLPHATPASWVLSTKAQIYETFGDLLYFIAQYEEAQEAYETALSALAGTTEENPVWLSRLERKTGSALLQQHRYEETLHYFDRAKAALGQKPAAADVAWWREWIDLQRERKYAYYWLNRWQEIAEIIDESRPILTQYGTPEQRALFFDLGMFLRRDRFAVSDEVLGYAREWLEANLELEDPVRKAVGHFSMGFALLWHGDLGEAEAEMRTALEMTDQTGDVNLRARCLTYLTIVYRKQQQVEEVRAILAESEAAAKEAAMTEYVATARANASWVAWRDGDYQQAQEQGYKALKLWQSLPAGHASCAFQWTALFPLIATTASEQNLDGVMDHVQAVLDPSQQKLPAELTAILQDAILVHEQNHPARAIDLVRQAVALAQQMGYL